jgi:molecular chaperone GrpE
MDEQYQNEGNNPENMTEAPPENEPAAGGEGQSGISLEEQLAAQKAEAEDLFRRLQRLQADFENYRKRTRREQEEFACYASEGLLRELLPVIDNLERALEAGAQGGDLDAFLNGVQLIYRQFMTLMEKQEVRPLEAVGQP